MKNKKLLLTWSVSLIVIAVITLVIAVTRMLGIAMPDMMIRVLGIIELIALPVFGFLTVKRIKEMKAKKDEQK